MRNPNGLGTINKLNGKRRKPFNAVVTTGYTIDGKQIRKSLGTFKTRKEALEKLLEYSNNPDILENGKITFKMIYDKWSTGHFKTIKKGTQKGIESKYRKYLYKFDDYNIKDIKLFTVQEFINDLKLSTGSKKAIKSLLHAIFEFARKNEIIDKNIIEFVELGKHKTVIKRKPFTNKEINILWEIKENETAKVLLILIYTGLRIGELLSLELSNIDLSKGILKVVRSKTETGIRTVPIHNKIMELVESQVKENKKFLFENTKNNPLHYVSFRNKFNKLMESLGMNHTIHDTRHTTATLLSNANVNPVSIKTILGHTDYNLTEKVYTHKDDTELEKAINRIN